MKLEEMVYKTCHRSLSSEHERDCIGDKCMAFRTGYGGNCFCKDLDEKL